MQRVRRLDAHPYWLLPVVLVMSMARGVTMSPRIQVYKAIACRALSDGSQGADLNLLTLAGCGDADVQARAVRIQASVVTIMSVLSAISTGFWSRAGDARGRKPILCVFIIGAVLMEAVFVLVMRPQSFFGKYAEHLILVGPILEGFVGGLSTFNGVVHAYVSDCTRHGSRSKIFSTIQGIVFVGLAIGPWVGGLFLPPTGYNDGFFFVSISLMLGTLLYVLFICPESLQHRPVDNTYIQDELQFKTSPVLVARRMFTKFISALLSPIAMFAPRTVPGQGPRPNYNMTFLGLGLFIYLVSTGVYSAKYLYAQHVYTWTTAQLGYYMSVLWISRAFNLLVFLPIVISYLKPKRTSTPGTNPNSRDIGAELKFDRYLAQASLGVDGFADSLVAITSNKSQATFIGLSTLSSFTSGGNPALHSLGAVCIHACGYGSEVGALFGAIGVLSAIAHTISPYIYALTYSSTVANFPQAIFVLAACLLFSAVALLNRVQPIEGEVAEHEPSTTEVVYRSIPDVEGDLHEELEP